MGRLVRVPTRANADLAFVGLEDVISEPVETQGAIGDNYLERIAKYVPFEAIAFFIAINAILVQAMKSGGADAAMAGLPVAHVAIGALAVGFVLTPLYVWYVRQEGDAWILNAVVSTLAFPFWAYALGAVAFAPYWDGNLAVILLAVFTVMSGLIAPRMPKPKKREKAAAPMPGPRRHLDLVEPSPA